MTDPKETTAEILRLLEQMQESVKDEHYTRLLWGASHHNILLLHEKLSKPKEHE